MILNELYKLNELSPDTLASYKKAAGADATAADAAGDYARGNKRFKGIVRATKKQFANDTKGVAEGHPSDNDMGVTTGGTKMTLSQWKQMWMKKMPNADFATLFRSPPSMSGSAIAYFDGWMNNPDARWNPEQGVAEGLGDLRPKLGSKRDQGKSVRKWRKARGMDESGMAESRDYSAVTNAITRRIITQHPEVLAKYGPDVVGQAIDEIADFVGDVDEIGSSDVSGWTSQVIRSLARFAPLREQGMAEDTDNPYRYRKGQTVKLDNGQQGRVIDIFDDSIEVLLVGGRTVTVDFRDAQVISEQDMAEGAMPASVIRIKEKIRLMSDAEKKEYFRGKTPEQLQKMARSHGYGENSNVYAKYATQGLNEFASGGGDDEAGELEGMLKSAGIVRNI